MVKHILNYLLNKNIFTMYISITIIIIIIINYCKIIIFIFRFKNV